MLERQDRGRSLRLGVDAAYSEHLGWYILGRAIEAAVGSSLREHLRNAVLDPLGMRQTFVGMSRVEFERVRPNLGVNVDLRLTRPYPMLLESSAEMCCETTAGHGGYTTAHDLGRFYRACLRSLSGEEVAGMPSAAVLGEFCSPARPRVHDAVLDRECTYGLGFMTDLADHQFGQECSPSSFGHSGNVGSSFAFADPAFDLVVSVVYNGVVDAESAFLRRRALVRSIYEDLALHAPSADAVHHDPAPARRRRWSRRRS